MKLKAIIVFLLIVIAFQATNGFGGIIQFNSPVSGSSESWDGSTTVPFGGQHHMCFAEVNGRREPFVFYRGGEGETWRLTTTKNGFARGTPVDQVFESGCLG